MIPAYVALGSNLNNPAQQLSSALNALSRLPETSLTACSPAYRSTAVGPGQQPDYLNAVAALRTALAPLDLLHQLQDIEQAQGRERGERWGARTLDLDILLYGNLVMDEDELTIPHPRMRDRNFVLQPLHDLGATLSLPCGTLIASLLQHCPAGDLVLHGELTVSSSFQEH